MKRLVSTAAAVLICLASGASASAADAQRRVVVTGTSLEVAAPEGEPKELDLGCVAFAVEQVGSRAYVACGPAGLVVVELEPELEVVARHDFGAPVSGFASHGDRLHVLLARTEIRPIPGDLPDSAPTSGVIKLGAGDLSPAPDKSHREPEAPVGKVVEWDVGAVVIDLGTEHGIARKDAVELFVEQPVEMGDGQTAVRERVVAVGAVVAVSEGRARVDLGLNERVPEGAKARPTDRKPTATKARPPRVGDIWQLQFNLRPFLALGTFGFGTVSDASLVRRMEDPISIHLRLEPLGLGFSDDGDIVAIAGDVVVAYDTDLFEIGLGAGWSAVSDDIARVEYDDRGDPTGTVEHVHHGLSIAQVARLGALDGVHLAVHNNFLFFHGEFHYGGTVGQFQLPITGRAWMIVRSGGGRAGYIFGELGLRVLATGNGDRGSFFITPTIGAATLFDEKERDCGDPPYPSTCVESVSYGGPMMGVGVEWRY